MNDTDLIIGELREFKRAALVEFAGINKRIDSLQEEQIRESNFRWKIRGEMAAIAAMLHPLIKIIGSKFGF